MSSLMELVSPALDTTLTSVLSVLLLLAVSWQLWRLRWTVTRDRECQLPLPKGSMGWPVVGETLHWLLQGPDFHISRRQKYGNVFKTHLLGKPVIRVTGAENIRKILLGEHKLVCAQWPLSARIILGSNTLVNSTGDLHRMKRKVLAKVFSRTALEEYIPRLQDIVECELARWCSERDPVDVYDACRTLTFRVATRVLLGLSLEDAQMSYLSKIFEQLLNNLFSLPIDVSFSGLRKGIKARETIHEFMAKIIEEKLQSPLAEGHKDAFDYMLSGAKQNNQKISIKELQETAVELVFAAHSTTASACTSLVLQLLRHPGVAAKARSELRSCGYLGSNPRPGSAQPRSTEREEEKKKEGAVTQTATPDPNPGTRGAHTEGGARPAARPPRMSLEKLSRLRYLDCVVKEVLRCLPPVSGGYRTALQTFELDGYQIPKGWSVMYSIRDTHETSPAYQNSELFDPDRFGRDRNEASAGRFDYIPFGGGTRSCIGKELARVILKVLAVELLSAAEWRLATETFPRMQTVPVVRPVNGLHVYFNAADHAHQ
ncbi:cytochrome P450 26B1-like [Scleropages formosus]|uniref:Cytochrome P450 family 26 subfamily C member 1 n=1 Tax=Scleropages formosus TaxID=113540 RepID=A0A8C9WQ04_SCLFO|nr:cytochrome P450 26B1-like [Scleropages formosus]